jgi:hypothetical protein
VAFYKSGEPESNLGTTYGGKDVTKQKSGRDQIPNQSIDSNAKRIGRPSPKAMPFFRWCFFGESRPAPEKFEKQAIRIHLKFACDLLQAKRLQTCV